MSVKADTSTQVELDMSSSDIDITVEHVHPPDPATPSFASPLPSIAQMCTEAGQKND